GFIIAVTSFMRSKSLLFLLAEGRRKQPAFSLYIGLVCANMPDFWRVDEPPSLAFLLGWDKRRVVFCSWPVFGPLSAGTVYEG
ncbi:hypothetical protein AD953_02545, partial [Acetobacter malorum]